MTRGVSFSLRDKMGPKGRMRAHLALTRRFRGTLSRRERDRIRYGIDRPDSPAEYGSITM